MFTLQFALALGTLLVLLFFMTGPFFPIAAPVAVGVVAAVLGFIGIAFAAFLAAGAPILGLGVLEQFPVIGPIITDLLDTFLGISPIFQFN